jgi:hypothetical protein
MPGLFLFQCLDTDTEWIRIALGQRIRIWMGNPDPGRPKLSPRKGRIEEITFLKSLNVLSRGFNKKFTVFDSFFAYFFKILS